MTKFEARFSLLLEIHIKYTFLYEWMHACPLSLSLFLLSLTISVHAILRQMTTKRVILAVRLIEVVKKEKEKERR